MLNDKDRVTISCAEGDAGIVYEGELPFDVETIELGNLRRPKTKIMMNIGTPDEAFALAAIPNDGVGLAREEFIISNFVKVHPRALLDYTSLDATTRCACRPATLGYDDKPQFFIDRLAEGVAMIAAAFYPKDVIVRMSDFKTNEYANLIGGTTTNPGRKPDAGLHGASRYYHPEYREAFAAECKAMRKVRDEMGLRNVKLMIPFCRTVEEGTRFSRRWPNTDWYVDRTDWNSTSCAKSPAM
ncbi:MAG: putative PEP-binding protein [Pirellulaceae bacterium]